MRIKHLLLLLAPIVTLFSCDLKKNEFTIQGKVANMPVHTVYLEELNINDIVIIDSAETTESGEFTLSGASQEQGLYRLRFRDNRFLLLSLHKEKAEVKADWNSFEDYTIAGSGSSESLRKFLSTVRDHLRDFNTMATVIDTFQAHGNDSMLARAKTDLQDMNIKFTHYVEEYSDTTKYLPNALFAARMLNPAVEKPFLDEFVAGLPKRFPNSKMAKDYTADYQRLVAGQQQQLTPTGPAIGADAPEISLPTPDGKTVNLSSMKGKYILVDFWASWCRPCRAENPNVVAAFDKFKNKNFTILGVSLDDDKDKWVSAIEKDGLAWTHISDLKGWESIAARNYMVESIPTNFLLDPDGKIIARDLRGADLETTLEGILK